MFHLEIKTENGLKTIVTFFDQSESSGFKYNKKF